LVGNDLTFYKFHYVLQTVMGWTNSHLHMFQLGDLIIGDPQDDETGDLGFKNERKYKLSQFNFDGGDKFIYEYDFGDSWRHKILIEKILPFSPDIQIRFASKAKALVRPKMSAAFGVMIHFSKPLLTQITKNIICILNGLAMTSTPSISTWTKSTQP